LRALDRVTIVAYDRSFVVRDVLVVDSDATHVRLAIRPNDIIRMGRQSDSWADLKFEVRWAGNGYSAFRLGDGIEALSTRFSSLEAAKTALFAQEYSVRRAS
jgi:hypothetical protein